MKEEENVMKTGTTTLGLICKDGIVLAADRRATSGYYLATKKIEKIHQISENLAVTMAGTASDAQMLVRLIKSELKLKNIRTGKQISVSEGANLLGRMVYQNIRKFSSIPGVSHFILAGRDTTGYHLFDVYADGTITECDDYLSSGSGSVIVFGVLETQFRKNMTVKEGIDLAIKSVNAAVQRDIASGNGIDVVAITEEGIKKVFDKELELSFKK